ncbi:hypothetical protein AGABI1DRAFT_133962 [Agaricus bisporus var. burnettii JB137-S8]|uniref:Uncharacterized protein n=1 Tax=Agaricus bisporus var. burnettii (strain JB137-S8 / ATCC MYA-4627 / FGSC 10392) TaxID=597362 RepID=K5VHM9_AGABU|nr:uncharacterized protein AGABI1DRAFT_133962 [Agaricus bisporus var. burnettii JB137-S8]EKM73859.1 hypothetical protein AGABI1DRAFT_133962 [Agaricus bisporus var. burnettii JB137-S8]
MSNLTPKVEIYIMDTSKTEEATLGFQEEHAMEEREDFDWLNNVDLPPKVPKSWDLATLRRPARIYDANKNKRSRANTQSIVHCIATSPSKKYQFNHQV